MRTTIYIDGYNLYYGLLKHSKYKWLDIYKLFQHIINIQSPQSSIHRIKFFTADIKSKIAGWTRQHIMESELSNAQLPDKVASNKKPIIKPNHW